MAGSQGYPSVRIFALCRAQSLTRDVVLRPGCHCQSQELSGRAAIAQPRVWGSLHWQNWQSSVSAGMLRVAVVRARGAEDMLILCTVHCHVSVFGISSFRTHCQTVRCAIACFQSTSTSTRMNVRFAEGFDQLLLPLDLFDYRRQLSLALQLGS